MTGEDGARPGRSEVDDVLAMVEGVTGDPAASEAAMALIRALRCWPGPVVIEPLPGGLSNLNFFAVCEGRRYVVRYGADMPDLGIRRSNEAAALRAANAAGVAPAVIHAEGDVIVMEAIEGDVLTPADLHNASLLRLVGANLARFHRDSAKHLDGPDFIFWPYHHGRWYVRQIEARIDRLSALYASKARELGAQVDPLEAVIGVRPIVFGHGDLVPQNIIRGPDGIRFIDLEYAGFAPDLFDLAGLGMNAELDRDETDVLLEAYFGTPPDANLHRHYGAMVLVASIRETTWCLKKMVGENNIAFDYRIYADMCLNRHERLMSFHGVL